jgi:hypothetical protein
MSAIRWLVRKQFLSFLFAMAVTVGVAPQGRAQTTVYNQTSPLSGSSASVSQEKPS